MGKKNNDIFAELYVATDNDLRDEWESFLKEFEKNHFFVSPEHELIEVYVKSLLKNKIIINENNLYYRARVNKTDPYRKFDDNDLKPPHGKLVNHGRLNPEGISFLYVTDEIKTAVSEVKPYLGAKVGIAICTPNKPLEIVNLVKEEKNKKTNDFRRLLSKLFSLPTQPGKGTLKYRSTQYIAEYIKNKGFDGVKYQSAVSHGGKNICFFDKSVMEISYSKEVIVNNIDIAFENSKK